MDMNLKENLTGGQKVLGSNPLPGSRFLRSLRWLSSLPKCIHMHNNFIYCHVWALTNPPPLQLFHHHPVEVSQLLNNFMHNNNCY